MLEIFTFIVSLILLVTPFIDWIATYILYKAATKIPPETNAIALRERAKMAGVLAISSTLNSSLAINRIFDLHFENYVAIVVLSISLILISVPNLYWLWLYRQNKLHS